MAFCAIFTRISWYSMLGTPMRFPETQHQAPPQWDPSREGLLSTSAKTLPAAQL